MAKKARTAMANLMKILFNFLYFWIYRNCMSWPVIVEPLLLSSLNGPKVKESSEMQFAGYHSNGAYM